MNILSRTLLSLVLGLALPGGSAWAQEVLPSNAKGRILLAANCTLGQVVSSGCTCSAPLRVVNGRCLAPGAQPGGQGLKQCPPHMKRVGGRCQLVLSNCKPGQDTKKA